MCHVTVTCTQIVITEMSYFGKFELIRWVRKGRKFSN